MLLSLYNSEKDRTLASIHFPMAAVDNVKMNVGSGVELEVGILDVHQARLSFQVVWSAVGEQLVVRITCESPMGRNLSR